jgi:hypothetical protein
MVRFYSVVQRQGKNFVARWIDSLKQAKFEVDDKHHLPISREDAALLLDYLAARGADYERTEALLRTEQEALAHCRSINAVVGKVATKSADHHQSSPALVAAVSTIALLRCQKRGIGCDIKPQRRCAWLKKKKLQVTPRNLDGAIPSLANPAIVWEIKEYWDKTEGGSKMSDALYECNLVGRELREFEQRTGATIHHVVFLDGREQWLSRKSDLRRFVDLFHQRIIDYLIVGREVETEWAATLNTLLA